MTQLACRPPQISDPGHTLEVVHDDDDELRSNLAEFLRALDDRAAMMHVLNQQQAERWAGRRRRPARPRAGSIRQALSDLQEAVLDVGRTIRRDNTERSALWNEGMERWPVIFERIDRHGTPISGLTDDQAITDHVRELLEHTTIEYEIDFKTKIVPALDNANKEGGTAKLVATLFEVALRSDVIKRRTAIKHHTDALRVHCRARGLI